MECWHLTLSTRTRMPVARDEAGRRAVVRRIVEVAGAWLVLFCVVDDHVHVVLVCLGDRVGRVRAALVHALRPLSAAPLAPPYVRAVNGRRHLQWLVDYLLTQTTHHDLAVHPARWSGSCLHDLVGARVLDGWQPRLFELLPRLGIRHVARVAGLDAGQLVPASDEAVRLAGAADLVTAASAALAAPPELRGRAPAVLRARRAAAQVGWAAGISDDELRWALRVSAPTLWRARRVPVEPAVLGALRLQVTLQSLPLQPMADSHPGERRNASRRG